MKRVFNLYNVCLVLILGLISVLTLTTTEVKAVGTVTWPSGSTATISRTVQNVYNAPVVDFTYSVSTSDTSLLSFATFDTGESVNIKMKDIANYPGFSDEYGEDHNIYAIKKATSLPNGFTPTANNTVSSSTSDYPMYIFFDSATHTLYYYSEANVIYLNSDCSFMFAELYSLTDISGLASLNTSKATNMDCMFISCTNLSDISALSNWDISSVTTMGGMFETCADITNIDALSNWDTSNVTSMTDIFSYCSSLININGASNWYTSNVTEMSNMFRESTSLININGASNWDVSSVTDMSYMFDGCTSLTNINALSNWNTSSVIGMSGMFDGCSSLTNINGASDWNTSSVTNMNMMFKGCTSLSNINGASTWDVSSVTTMSYMFDGCTSLSNINGASNWDTSKVTDMGAMFYNCTNASGTIQILKNISNSTYYSNMFYNAATASGAQITVNYSSNVTNINRIIATKSNNSNVVKGSVVSIPSSSGGGSSSSGGNSQSGGSNSNSSSGTTFYTKTLSFDGSETVSNSYTVSKSTTINLANMGLSFPDVGTYELTVKETGTSNDAYPEDEDNEYTIVIQVENVLDANNRPTGNFNATFVIKDKNDNKQSSCAFSEPKNESKFGHIELTKTVKGIMADRTKDFSFSVQVDDAASNACQSYSLGEKYLIKGTGVPEDGSEVTKCKSGTKDTITLKHGQSATIGRFTYNSSNYNSISIDDYYKIEEALESDYTTTFKKGSGSETSGRSMNITAVSSGSNAVTFYNQKEGSPLTGLVLTILPYLILIGIGIGGVLLYRKIGANKRTV